MAKVPPGQKFGGLETAKKKKREEAGRDGRLDTGLEKKVQEHSEGSWGWKGARWLSVGLGNT